MNKITLQIVGKLTLFYQRMVNFWIMVSARFSFHLTNRVLYRRKKICSSNSWSKSFLLTNLHWFKNVVLRYDRHDTSFFLYTLYLHIVMCVSLQIYLCIQYRFKDNNKSAYIQVKHTSLHIYISLIFDHIHIFFIFLVIVTAQGEYYVSFRTHKKTYKVIILGIT